MHYRSGGSGLPRAPSLWLPDKPDPTAEPSSPETQGSEPPRVEGSSRRPDAGHIGNIFRRPPRSGNPRSTGGDKLKPSLLELFCLSWFQQELDEDVGGVGEARRRRGEPCGTWSLEGRERCCGRFWKFMGHGSPGPAPFRLHVSFNHVMFLGQINVSSAHLTFPSAPRSWEALARGRGRPRGSPAALSAPRLGGSRPHTPLCPPSASALLCVPVIFLLPPKLSSIHLCRASSCRVWDFFSFPFL